MGFTISHEQQGLAVDAPGPAAALLASATLTAVRLFTEAFKAERGRLLNSRAGGAPNVPPNISYAIARQAVDLDRVMARCRVDVDDALRKKLLSAEQADGAAKEISQFCSRVERSWRLALRRELDALTAEAKAKTGPLASAAAGREPVGSDWSVEVEVVWRENWIGRYTSLLYGDL